MVVGSVELLPVRDAVGVLGELAELYPDVPAAAWERYRELYPELFSGESWRVPCACYPLRSGGRTLLADTGVGPSALWDWTAEFEGGLLPGLAEHGVRPPDVAIVLNTHVHIDHVGWNTNRDGEVVFPAARLAIHEGAIVAARSRSDRPHIGRCVVRLLERRLVDTFAVETELLPGVTVFPLPGHDPGHVGLRIGTDAVLIADAAVHPALLDEPDWVYVSDHDHERSAATRRALVEELADADILVVSGHYPGSGIGRVVSRDGRVVWEEAPA